jgi:hypothetical protein
VEKLLSGTSPRTIIYDLYLDRHFPEPRLVGPSIRHIASGRELMEVGRSYRNCLVSRIGEGIRGRSQFYVLDDTCGLPVIFSIANEEPFGWYFEEAKLPNNRQVPPARLEQLASLMRQNDIRMDGPIEKLMQPFWGPRYDGPIDLPLELNPV